MKALEKNIVTSILSNVFASKHVFGLFYHFLARFFIAGPLCTNCHKYATCFEGKCVCKAGYLGNGNVCEGIYDLYFRT